MTQQGTQGQPMKSIRKNILLPPDMAQALEEEAQRREWTPPQVVRAALKAYLKKGLTTRPRAKKDDLLTK
jgi:hypothetical protein